MRRDEQIRVNELLLKREELFLRIHAAETEVSRIFGGPFPFTLPDLPSARRGKRKASDARPASGQKSARSSSDSLRRLEDGESGYRVIYRQFSKTLVEDHHEFEALRTLLACQSSNLQVQSVETLTAGGKPGACLFSAPPTP